MYGCAFADWRVFAVDVEVQRLSRSVVDREEGVKKEGPPYRRYTV